MKLNLLKLSLAFTIAFSGMLSAQQISGNVSDETGPLPGATVVVQGTTTGVVADFDGNYSISASAGDVLVFSYVGYTAQAITVGNQNTINIVLQSSNELEEVLVTGYGSQQQKEITSAVTSISAEEFNQGAINDASQLLQGKVAGLQIYNRGGDPNAGTVIRLRGLSSLGANISPLVVIDGVGGASLNNVDPSDIESYTVLKDASAAAIYGSRGSSGVIIVTTKSGGVGAAELTYSGQLSSSSILNQIDTMSPQEFIAAGGRDLSSQTDWLDEVTRDAFTHIHNISATGGNGKTNYRVSANLREAEGILLNSGFDQFNTRLNFSTRALDDRLKIDFNTSFTQRDQKNGFKESMRYATLYNPTAPVYAVDAPYAFNGAQFGGYYETLGLFDSYNPVSIINQNLNNGERRELNYGINLTYDVSDNIMIPRPDTELVIEKVLDLTANKKKLNILEIGIGSGCILLSILKERKSFYGTGIDISKSCLKISKLNAIRLKLTSKLKLFKSNVDKFNLGKYDLIISNPPYIKNFKLKYLEKDVAKFEPKLALDGGLDGLSAIRKVIKKSSELIKKNGRFVLEIGFDQKNKVISLLKKEGFYINSIYKDLANNDRCIVCTKI